MRKILYAGLALTLIALTGLAFYQIINVSGSPQNGVVKGRPEAPTSSFDKKQYSTRDPSSIWIVVNKQHPLDPKSFSPTDLLIPHVPVRVPGNETMQLRRAAGSALENMFVEASKQGLSLMLASGYRSYNYQVNLYNGYVASSGLAQADSQSARPGYSEHQTGLAADIEPTTKKCELEQCFAATPEGQWLLANSYTYGYILRYTPSGQKVTGYDSEPWHYRYVGSQLATEIHSRQIPTLEKFFGISGGSSY